MILGAKNIGMGKYIGILMQEISVGFIGYLNEQIKSKVFSSTTPAIFHFHL